MLTSLIHSLSLLLNKQTYKQTTANTHWLLLFLSLHEKSTHLRTKCKQTTWISWLVRARVHVIQIIVNFSITSFIIHAKQPTPEHISI